MYEDSRSRRTVFFLFRASNSAIWAAQPSLLNIEFLEFRRWRDSSINRPRKKARRGKMLVMEARASGTAAISVLESVRPATFTTRTILCTSHQEHAYALLTTIVCFSSLPESIVVIADSDSPSSCESVASLRNVTKSAISLDRRNTRAEFCTLPLSHCRA